VVASHTKTTAIMRWELPPEHEYVHTVLRTYGPNAPYLLCLGSLYRAGYGFDNRISNKSY
jgi:hypothetical protein